MADFVSLSFASPPAPSAAYLRILLSRKPRQVPDGQRAPRIAAALRRFEVDPAGVARYRAVCGAPPSDAVPIAYPHVLAGPLHLAVLAHTAFPVQAMGLVHVRNRIVQRRPLRAGEAGTIEVWVDGHRDTDGGQEFDLHTEVRTDSGTVWSETFTVLARRRGKSRRADARRSGGGAPSRPVIPEAASVSTVRADAGVGRRYAAISRDYNPIHLTGFSARLFGFDRPIAHGMWSLARCAAEIGDTRFARACVLDTRFNLPLFLPGEATLRAWESHVGLEFALCDSGNGRALLTGGISGAS